MTVIIDLRRRATGKTTGATKPPSERVKTCLYVGPPTGETVLCDSCRGRVRLKVVACEKFGTTTSKQCNECHEYKPKDEVK